VLVNADFKALEWLGAVYLSKDPVGYDEITKGVDQHKLNQGTFGFGEGEDGRLLAKTFVFRLIYGGSAYSYANDARFSAVSTKERFWQDVIDKFYSKYRGIGEWHNRLMEFAMRDGRIDIPTGRSFRFQPIRRGRDLVWPRTTILNYPVQGFGADLMVLARTSLWTRFNRGFSAEERAEIKWCCTVHDSIVWDVPSELVSRVGDEIFRGWAELPNEYRKVFGQDFDLPMKVEVKYGKDWKNMTEIKETK
jgi:DNA polymerase I-like protein with 3'-5' exonuclease and polymerase domains